MNLRGGLTAERVVEVAAQLADEAGFSQVTPSAVARRVDVKVASLYSHVRGADDLRTRVALLALTEMADRLAVALAGRSGKDAVRALADTYRDYAREHPGRYEAAGLRLDATTAASSAGPRHAEMARAVLRGYQLNGPAQTHAVRLIGALVHGYVRLELGGGFDHSSPASQVTWERVIDALDTLLLSWPAATDPLKNLDDR